MQEAPTRKSSSKSEPALEAHAPQAGSAKKRRVLIVDDHPIFRNGISQLIDGQTDLEVCGGVSSAPHALSAIDELKPDMLVVDISLNGTNGIELMKSIRAQHPKLPVLIVSMHDENTYAERALRAGARGYIMKAVHSEKVLEAVRRVLEGGMYVSETLGARLLQNLLHRRDGSGDAETSALDQLSDREIEVFRALGEGKSTREIAWALHLSTKTVETHRAHLKKKLQLNTATELVRAAVEWVNREANA